MHAWLLPPPSARGGGLVELQVAGGEDSALSSTCCTDGVVRIGAGADGHGHAVCYNLSGADSVWLDVLHVMLLLTLLALCIGTILSPAFERVVWGSIADTIAEAGISFTKYLSLWDLPWMTAEGGGLDYIMAFTFFVFIIIGPIA